MSASPASPAVLRDQLRFVVVGHVDHGKSTLIGRLLHDTDSLPAGKLEELQAISARRGMALEWSFVLDAFQAERDQAITIDTTQIWFKTDARDFVIIDAPGHREFLKNMISGAAQADAAVLVVDAVEGVREQTRRHAYLLRLLGLDQVAVVVNKMDMVNHAESRFIEVSQEVNQYLAGIDIRATAIIPISARHGDNIAAASAAMPWYPGPTLLGALSLFRPRGATLNRPFRMPVQDVYHFDDRRIIVGRIESGSVSVGDEILVSPSNRTARIKTIEMWNTHPPVVARAGDAIGLTFEDQIFVERGDVLSHGEHAPKLTTVFAATVFWLGHTPLAAGRRYRIKLMTSEADMTVDRIERVIDSQNLEGRRAEIVERNEVAEVVFRGFRMLAVDDYTDNSGSGRFVIMDGYDVVGGGQIDMTDYPDQRQALRRRSSNIFEVDHMLDHATRARRNGHAGAVIWLTGLSGAGKSTIAMRVEQRLFAKGYQTYVLDGDNVRAGLNGDLGFSPEDRAENIRRVGEVAALFADAGVIVLTAFISPYRADRQRARECRPEQFHEVHVKAGVETCAARDPKGLYKRAMAGEIKEFTGVSAPYETPDQPELVVDTEQLPIDACVEAVVSYVEQRIARGRDAA